MSSHSASDSGYSSSDHYQARKVRSPPVSELYRSTAIQDQIEEEEETTEEVTRGCSFFSASQKLHMSDKSEKNSSANRWGKKNMTKERCSLM